LNRMGDVQQNTWKRQGVGTSGPWFPQYGFATIFTLPPFSNDKLGQKKSGRLGSACSDIRARVEVSTNFVDKAPISLPRSASCTVRGKIGGLRDDPTTERSLISQPCYCFARRCSVESYTGGATLVYKACAPHAHPVGTLSNAEDLPILHRTEEAM
jgi:hypothetical protein